jgi:hypothetical protein
VIAAVPNIVVLNILERQQQQTETETMEVFDALPACLPTHFCTADSQTDV